MPDVTIRFKAEGGSQVDREIEARAAKLRAASVGDVDAARRSATARRRVESGAAADSIREARRVAAEQAKADAESIRQRMRGLILQGTAQAKAEAKVREMVAQTTKIIEAETGKRVALGSAEHRQVMQLVSRRVAAEGAAQEEITRATAKAAAQRERTVKDSLGRIMKAGAAIGSSVMGVAGNLHGQAQDARRTRALADRTLNGAFIQVGATNEGEMNALRGKIASTALAHGIDYGELASTIAETQSKTNALGGATSDERMSKLNDILDNAVFANAMHVDPKEITQYAGMLSQNGITGAMQKELVRNQTQLSFNGSVEVGDLLKSGLQPLMRYMNAEVQKLGPNATEEQRRAVIAKANLDFNAQAQLQAAAGNSVRFAGGRFAGLDTVLQNFHVQDLMGSKLDATLKKGSAERDMFHESFHQNASGAWRLNTNLQNPMDFARVMAGIFHGNGAAFSNLMGAHGAGMAQALQKPDTALIAAMMGMKDGKYMFEAIQNLVNNSKMTPEQVTAAEGVTQNEEMTKILKAQESQAQALTDTTSALVRFSNALDDFAKGHPVATALAGAAAPLALSAGGSAASAVASKVIAPAASAAGVSGGAAAAGLAVSALAGLTAGTAFTRWMDTKTGYKGPGGSHDTLIEGNTYKELGKALMGNDAAGNDAVNAQRVQTSAAAFAFVRSHAKELASLTGDQAEAAQRAIKRIGIDTDTIDQLARAIGVQMAGANITATVSPVDAAHAAAQGASAAQPPPTRGHRR